MNSVEENNEIIRCPICGKNLSLVKSKYIIEEDGVYYCSELCRMLAKKER